MSSKNQKLFSEISASSYSEPLSEILPKLLHLSRRIGYKGLEKWVRLELDGYLGSNPAMSEDVVVPEYRTIAGFRSNEYGTRMVIQDPDLHFVNEDRLRQGVAELERYASMDDHITVRDLSKSDIIRETFEFDATRFTFHSTAVDGIMSSIRSQMQDWLFQIENKYPDLDLDQPKDIQKSASKEDRFRGLRVLGVTLLVISSLALTLLGIDKWLVSLFSSTSPTILFLAALGLAIGILLQLKSVFEFVDKVLPD